MADYEDYDEEDEGYVLIRPQRFSKVTLLRAGLDFAGHVLEGARCALGIVEAAVVSHEMRVTEERELHEELMLDLESIPEVEE